MPAGLEELEDGHNSWMMLSIGREGRAAGGDDLISLGVMMVVVAVAVGVYK